MAMSDKHNRDHGCNAFVKGERMRKVAMASVVLTAILALPAGVSFAEGNATKGKGLYDKNCASCHGAGGKGDGVAAASLKPKPKDLADKTFMAGLKDEQLIDVIKKGGAAVGKSPLMPPYGAALKDQDVQDVVAFIRSLVK
jgi:mono/diheme cytochrome c family protein